MEGRGMVGWESKGGGREWGRGGDKIAFILRGG